VSTETNPEKVVSVSEKQFAPKKTPSKEEVLLCRIAYKLSYNTETRQPNWVAWTLTRDHSDGPYSRKGVPYYDDNGNIIGILSSPTDVVRGDFIVDKDVSCPRQEHIDWKEHPIGIDHGHMCPAADCKWDKGAMNQSFLLTNICPQDRELNGGDWDKLEKKCRTWAKQYGQIYIVAGPIFMSDEKRCFGMNQIPIPDAFFKVVLCMTGNPKAIGFVFPNSGTHQNLKEYVQTVDDVERITGIDFFPAIPDDIENEVEAKVDIGEW
jgi:endonuclease G